MYWLYGIDTVVRIAAALALLFVAIPALAWPRPATFSRLAWFWWNFGVGITLLTLAGQIFTLFNIASAVTYLALFAAIIVLCRARRAGMPPLRWLRETWRNAVLFSLRVLDRGRDAVPPLPATPAPPRPSRAFFAWAAVILVAAITRFYRPFATANLGFPDTYVHLYLMRLLDQGRQVDPAWGPYPRGMHFLLLPIERLTNVDTILLMNFFGAFSGLLLTMAAAYAAQRITRSTIGAVVAGLLFATMIGGARQYFALGASATTATAAEARQMLSKPYGESGDDLLLHAFERQTATLPQELAIVLLLPAFVFLLDWFRRRDAWTLTGFIGCTAAMAAVHSGVVIALVFLCAAAAVAALACRTAALGDVVRAAAAGAAGVVIGSSWMLGFIRYRSVAGRETVSADSHVGATALYYFPFLRSFAGGEHETTYTMLTPFLTFVLIAAAVVTVLAVRERAFEVAAIAVGAAVFVVTHAASVLGIPELIEVRRNATWLALTTAVLLGVLVAALATRVPARARRAVPAAALLVWFSAVPNPFGEAIRTRLIDHSGYGSTAYAVLRISQHLQPFTWTLVSYGQEYPMVLGRGFHLTGAEFLERFDPAEPLLHIPTPHVFIAVEKRPHSFEIDSWSARFDRAAIEERLHTWCMVYGMTHRNIRVFLDDENVTIYEIRKGGPAGLEARM